MSRLTIVLVAFVLCTLASSAQAFQVCAKEDHSNPGHPKEKSNLFLKTACDPAKHEVAVGVELSGTVGTDAVVAVSGANLQVLSGSGSTYGTTNGLGNVIIGYNEATGGQTHAGSHNLVVGPEQEYTANAMGGIVNGGGSTIDANGAVAVGGLFNVANASNSCAIGGESGTAGGVVSVVLGGVHNTASSYRSSVTGGSFNTASGLGGATVSGGSANTAMGFNATVSGGSGNVATGDSSSVSGGEQNLANGPGASISGGLANKAQAFDATVCGGAGNVAGAGTPIFYPAGTQAPTVTGGYANAATGDGTVVSGGRQNTASSFWSAVSGGSGHSATGQDDWVAGQLFQDF